MRMYPAWHTRPTPRSSRAAMMAFSWASRLGYCFGSTKSASMPCARAISSAGAVARSDTSTAITAGTPPDSIALASASKFEPRPEARTPTRRSSGIDHRAGAGPDLAHVEDALPRLAEQVRGSPGVPRPDHEEIAQPLVEGATHLGLLHPTRLLDEAEDGGHGPGARVDEGLTALGEHRSEERRVGKECRARWSPCH